MITLRRPCFFSELGQKDNQEDYIYPSLPDASDRIFILCDGMGGHERGEVASSTVANAIGSMLNGFTARSLSINDELFNRALIAGYDALETIPGADAPRKPGTTLTCLCFNPSSYLAAHMGDSRIYQIRPSRFDAQKGELGIIYRSRDHSLVNDLVRAGQITEEQARTHPRRNVITRALQPKLEKRFAATIHESADIRPGDFFFLCSDGVLERVTDRTLCEILANPDYTSDEQKMEAIRSQCLGATRDNFSAMLIPVEDVTVPRPVTKKRGSYTAALIILSLIILLAIAGITAYYTGYFGQSQPKAEIVIDTLTEEPQITPDTIITPVLPAADTIATSPVPEVKPEPQVTQPADAQPQHKPDTAKNAPKAPKATQPAQTGEQNKAEKTNETPTDVTKTPPAAPEEKPAPKAVPEKPKKSKNDTPQPLA